MSFVAACSKFFGKKPDQTFASFLAEIKQLTDKDRTDMAPLLSVELGEDVSPTLYVK
jgi:hypothetical protein